MPIFSNKKKGFFFKEFSSKDNAMNYINDVALKEKEGMYFSVARIDIMTPAEDIDWLCSFVCFDYVPKLSMEYFPRNWGYKKIILFLINKINKEEIKVSWEKELKADAAEYGLHDKDDFNVPYIEN